MVLLTVGGLFLAAAAAAPFLLPPKPASAIRTALAWIYGVVTVVNMVVFADDFGPYRRRPRRREKRRRARNPPAHPASD